MVSLMKPLHLLEAHSFHCFFVSPYYEEWSNSGWLGYGVPATSTHPFFVLSLMFDFTWSTSFIMTTTNQCIGAVQECPCWLSVGWSLVIIFWKQEVHLVLTGDVHVVFCVCSDTWRKLRLSFDQTLIHQLGSTPIRVVSLHHLAEGDDDEYHHSHEISAISHSSFPRLGRSCWVWNCWIKVVGSWKWCNVITRPRSWLTLSRSCNCWLLCTNNILNVEGSPCRNK